MNFALAVYNATAAAAGASNVDFAAATDPVFTQRNSHYTFTAPFTLAGVSVVGASVTKGRFQAPTWNAWTEYDIHSANRSATVPVNAQWDWYGLMGPQVPTYEEFQVQVSNNLGAATEVESAALILLPAQWNANRPQGSPSFWTTATFTATPVANAWGAQTALTFTQTPRSGVYAIDGAILIGTNALAFRFIFPRIRLYQGLPIRPGWLVQNALGDAQNNHIPNFPFHMGEWGRFHTFELPQVELFGLTAGAITYTMFMHLTYLGADPTLLQQAA